MSLTIVAWSCTERWKWRKRLYRVPIPWDHCSTVINRDWTNSTRGSTDLTGERDRGCGGRIIMRRGQPGHHSNSDRKFTCSILETPTHRRSPCSCKHWVRLDYRRTCHCGNASHVTHTSRNQWIGFSWGEGEGKGERGRECKKESDGVEEDGQVC